MAQSTRRRPVVRARRRLQPPPPPEPPPLQRPGHERHDGGHGDRREPVAAVLPRPVRVGQPGHEQADALGRQQPGHQGGERPRAVLADTRFAVTGARYARPWTSRNCRPGGRRRRESGQTLTLQPPASGARAYLTVAGGIDVPVILGSRSTHLRSEFGGLAGRFLHKGDVLQTLAGNARSSGIRRRGWA